MMCVNAVSRLSCLGGQKFWILWQAWTDSHFCPLPWWGIRNSEYFDNHEQIPFLSLAVMGDQKFCGILVELEVDSRLHPVTVSCSCVLIQGIRNSEYFYNHEQIAVFVPCQMSDQKFWILVELKIDHCFVLLSYGPGDQKFWISPRKKAQWVRDLFHMKLHNLMELENWMCRCGHNWTLFFLLLITFLISENLSEIQTFSASNTSTLLNFPKLESHILVWKSLDGAYSLFLLCIQYIQWIKNLPKRGDGSLFTFLLLKKAIFQARALTHRESSSLFSFNQGMVRPSKMNF